MIFAISILVVLQFDLLSMENTYISSVKTNTNTYGV